MIYLSLGVEGVKIEVDPETLSLLPKGEAAPAASLTGSEHASRKAGAEHAAAGLALMADGNIHEIKSVPVGQLTSVGMQFLKSLMIAAHEKYTAVSASVKESESSIIAKEKRLMGIRRSIFGFLYRKRAGRYATELAEMKSELGQLNETKRLARVRLQVSADETFLQLYQEVAATCKLVTTCAAVWDITSSREIDRVRERSAAGVEITRTKVMSFLEGSDLIATQSFAFKLENRNGGDLFFYPGFVIVQERALDFAILDYSEFNVSFRVSRFVESDPVPSDTTTDGTTWAKVNKDGSPDRRFANNYPIPIARYGEITFSSPTGLQEKYMFSNEGHARVCYTALKDYIDAIRRAGSAL